jgi:hypothetical protein
MKKTSLKLTTNSHLKMLSSCLIFSALYLGIFFYVGINEASVKILLPVIIIMTVLPTACIHYSYYIISKRIIYVIDESGITKKAADKDIRYEKNDFKKIVFRMNRRRIMYGYSLIGLCNYYYCEITLFDGTEILITSLFSTKLEEIFKEYYSDIPQEPESFFYPIILQTSYRYKN